MSRRNLRAAATGVAAAWLAIGMAGCGSQDEEGSPPEITSPQIACAEAEDGGSQVIASVSVRVTDPDRDLVTDDGALEGRFDGLQIELTDPNADQRFNWEPSGERGRIRCDGEHDLVVWAEDATGREATLDQTITSDGSS